MNSRKKVWIYSEIDRVLKIFKKIPKIKSGNHGKGENEMTDIAIVEGNREKLKATIASFALTFVVALSTKLVTLMLARPEIDSLIIYMSDQYSFWFQLVFGSGTAAFITRHFVSRSSK